MNTYELIAPCHFGLESVLKREIYDLGYEITSVEDGKVTFEGDAEAICRANLLSDSFFIFPHKNILYSTLTAYLSPPNNKHI